MALIIETGSSKKATHKERCARCRKTINIGDMRRTAQVHYAPPRYDYRFGSVHYPNCKKA